MAKRICLTKTDCQRYVGVFQYLVSYDHMSGKSDRYTVFVLNAEDPVVIGRELPLEDCCGVIQDFENFGDDVRDEYTGDRETVLKVMGFLENQRDPITSEVQAEYEAACQRAWSYGCERSFGLKYETAREWRDRPTFSVEVNGSLPYCYDFFQGSPCRRWYANTGTNCCCHLMKNGVCRLALADNSKEV